MLKQWLYLPSPETNRKVVERKQKGGGNERKKKGFSFLQSRNLAIYPQMGKASPCSTTAVQATPVMVHISALGC